MTTQPNNNPSHIARHSVKQRARPVIITQAAVDKLVTEREKEKENKNKNENKTSTSKLLRGFAAFYVYNVLI